MEPFYLPEQLAHSIWARGEIQIVSEIVFAVAAKRNQFTRLTALKAVPQFPPTITVATH